MSNNNLNESPVPSNVQAAPQKNVFMTLLRSIPGSDENSEPDIALKIEPIFDPAYKPSQPSEPKTVVNVLALKGCTATTLAVHDRIIAIGTSMGSVMLADPLGHVDHKVNVFHVHARAVTALDIDASGEYVLSGGEDGRVVVLDLALAASAKNPQLMQITHDRVVRAVAIEPDFNRNRDRRIIVACGGRVILYVQKKASIFSSNEPQQNVLVEGVVSITQIAWQPSNGLSSLIAWATERGEVTVYDERRKTNAGKIGPEPAQIVAATAQTNKVTANFNMSLAWLPQIDSNVASSLLVVCGSLVRLFRIVGADDPRGSDIVTPRLVQLTHRILLGAEIAVEAVVASVDRSANLNFAACCISQPYQLVLCGIGDYRPQPVPQPLSFPFPVSEELVGMASLPLDRQTYALTKNGTLYVIKISSLVAGDAQAVLTDYVDYLLTIGDAAAAAALLPRVFDSKNRKSSQRISWEEWLSRFDQLGQIPAVAAYLPTSKPAANSGITFPSRDRYDMVLGRILKHSTSQFEELLSLFAPDLYSTDAVMTLVQEALVHDPSNRGLLASLAFLCCHKRQFDRAVNLLLDLRHETLFKVVADNSLYHMLQKRVTELVACGPNSDVAVDMLTNQADKFPANAVIAQLRASIKNPRSAMALFSYLKRMFTLRQDDLQYSDVDLLVVLYADLDPANLLTFLRSSDAYRLENALAECRQRKRHRECVYLLGKGGKTPEAIDVIIKELGSVQEAVDFCREKGGSSQDRDLWMILAEKVVTHRPDLVAELLRLTGTELLDPAEVIKLIPNSRGRFVPGLRQALEGSLSDSERQLSLLSSAKKVVGNDLSQVFKEITKSTFSATVIVDDRVICLECREPLSNNRSASMRIVAFSCHHAFHYACLTSADDANCPSCGRLKEPTTGHAGGGGGGGGGAIGAAMLNGNSPSRHSPIPVGLSHLSSSIPLSSPLSQIGGLITSLSKNTVRS